MSNLTDHVVSLELARKLKALGLRQDSQFYWIKESDPYIWFNSGLYPTSAIDWGYSAYLASELMEAIPAGVCQTDKVPLWDDEARTYSVYYAGDSFHAKSHNLCDAYALCLMHIIENNYVDDEWRVRWLEV